MKDFFIDTKNKSQAKLKEKPYFYLPREVLRQKVDAHKKKMIELRKPSPLSDYDRSLVKSHDADKKRKRASGKDVPQLGQQKQPMQNLVVANEYGSNIEVYRPDNSGEVSVQALNTFFQDTGLTLDQLTGKAPIQNLEVDTWKTYKYGKSLYNPAALNELGTQMYLLNKWYMQACGRGEQWIFVRFRDHHYFRGDDILHISFEELHQLFHLDALDKSIMSSFCL